MAGLAGLGRRTGARRAVRGTKLLVPGRQGPMESAYDRAIMHEAYSTRARIVSRTTRLFIQPLLRVIPINGTTIRATRSLERLSARAPRSKHVEPIGFTLGGVRVESMTHRYAPDSRMTILYFHGGGFMSGGIDSHRRLCETLAHYSGATVISVDYVQLPEGTVADSVQDAISAYEGLLEISLDPDKIVVAGDSAGGYLAMKVAELATRRGLRRPVAVLGFSPMLSLDPERNDKAVERITPVNDAYLPPSRIRRIRAMWTAHDSVIEGFAAPLHASAYITSPVFLTAVEDELLRPEIEAMSMVLTDKGIEVETHIWRRGIHAFPVIADLLPEGREALRLASAFARIAVGELDRPTAADRAAAEVVEGELIPDSAGTTSEPEIIEGEFLDVRSGRRFRSVS